MELIRKFYDKIRKGKDNVSFKVIEKIFNFDIHPEVKLISHFISSI